MPTHRHWDAFNALRNADATPARPSAPFAGSHPSTTAVGLRPGILEADRDDLGSMWRYSHPAGVVTFRTISALARAIGRSSKTVRHLEHEGLLPPARFWLDRLDKRADRRLYTEYWVAEVGRIAVEEKVLGRKIADWSTSLFPDRIADLYYRLSPAEELERSAQYVPKPWAELGMRSAVGA